MINADRRFVDTSAPIAILAVREYGSGREWHDERYRDFRRRNGHYREVKNGERILPHPEAFQAVVWHCLVKHKNLE
jgi:hypothetical protein